MPAHVTKQKQQQTPTAAGGGCGSRCSGQPFKWLLYISIVLVLVLAITVVSSYVLKMDYSSSGNGQLSGGGSTLLEASNQQESIIKDGANSNSLQDQGQQSGGLSSNDNNNKPTATIKTQVPVIGVLSQVLRDYKRFTKDHHLHIASSYVKWLESAGAQIVPILLNQNDYYYEQIFSQTNGLVLPGGDNLLDPNKSTPMMVAAKKLYKLAVRANDDGHYYPIWGTCLGLELLSVLTSNLNVLDSCIAIDEALPMSFVQRGKLFAPVPYANMPELSGDYSKVILDKLSSMKLTYNFHRKCLTDAGLERAGLRDFYRPLAYSEDINGNKFIAIFEAIKYPFYGVQFHPEKPAFEFVVKSHQYNIPHSREAIAVSRFFGDFFVQQAQLNDHKTDARLIQDHLIYAHSPMYTAPLNDIYEQRYLFPFGSDFGASTTEEFIEHLVSDDELAPEEIVAVETTAGGSIGSGSSLPLELAKKLVAELPNASEGLPQRDFYILQQDNNDNVTTTHNITNETTTATSPKV